MTAFTHVATIYGYPVFEHGVDEMRGNANTDGIFSVENPDETILGTFTTWAEAVTAALTASGN